MGSGQRVVIDDVTKSSLFAGQPSLDVLLDAGVRAVQSTPLMSADGMVFGMISTHFNEPHRPGERELRLMDLLAWQAADYLERRHAEEALRAKEAELQAHKSIVKIACATRQHERRLVEVSHELRNPLNVTMGYSELLLRS